jgi:alpha-1,3-rhamnosyl/mannosyltransferase
MKVGFDVGPLKPRPAGVGVYVRSLALALAELPDVNLMLFGRRPDAIGLPETPFGGRSARVPYPVWVELAAPYSIPRDAEVVHFTDGLVPIVRRRPTVVTVLDLSPVRHWRSHRVARYPRIPLVLAAPRLATRVVVPSQATADEVIQLTKTSARRIDVVPLAPVGPDRTSRSTDSPEVLARHGLASRAYLLALGTIEPRKNHVRVVQAFERVIASGALPSDVLLAIAGQPGWRSEAALRAIAESPASSRIRLLGYVPDADVPALLREAAAVVYASTYEGFGLPVLEAMAEGASVVTSNVSSMPEAAGDAGVLVDPFDVASIANGIEEAVRSADSMRDRARAHAATFTWANTAEGTLDAYRRALD